MTLNGSTPLLMDDFVTDIPASDSISNYNYFSVMWDNANTRLGLIRSLGVIDVLSSAPSGPPGGLPSGKGWLGCVGNTLYMWDGSSMHSQVF